MDDIRNHDQKETRLEKHKKDMQLMADTTQTICASLETRSSRSLLQKNQRDEPPDLIQKSTLAIQYYIIFAIEMREEAADDAEAGRPEPFHDPGARCCGCCSLVVLF